ncbi:hypothetical protein R4Z09_01615 [Niallia oryzisoli]|uniref:Uncharacterized protein n=1 Tax=Niallia oryzisoli TaxID=1737571 RepID=A0ABZ2CIY2_9BACI
MVMVCKDHVTKGVRVLPAPHVKQIPEKRKECCLFCKQQAAYQLFTIMGAQAPLENLVSQNVLQDGSLKENNEINGRESN